MDLSHLQPRVSTSTSSAFPPHRTQIHPRMHFSTFPPPYYRVDRLRVLVAGLLAVPFLLYLVSVARGTHLTSRFAVSHPKGFCVIIDARATASRVHVFEFLNDGRIPFVGFDSKGSVSLSARPGIRALAAEPDRAGASLRGLLEFAKGRVPRSVWVETTVRLIDNGGLRGLTQELKRAILESCRRELRASGFLFKDYWASSITGQEKGIYAWVAANYVLGTLGAAPEDTLGIIELGEASTQVAFVIDKQHPMEVSRILELPGRTYKIYSNSTYEYSQDITWESLQNVWSSNMLMKSSDYMNEALMSPCIPKGYNHSALQPNSMGRRISSTNLQGGFNACRDNISGFSPTERWLF
ncbi:hypothetical protein HPP92_014958 [Vanilla planifolia]|uniref:Apyrase n=1 Tax=Vanilla planifolia TaxID=51239 RepID=A0A835QWV3_VANPL|nr:hypothetical protein HPP92_014958 [Vanilla planifolia]